jgi:hypothetical protein
MKRFLALIICFGFSCSLFASNEDLFKFNKNNIEQQFEALNFFEDQVLSTSTTLEDIENNSNNLINQSELLTGISLVSFSNRYTYNIPYSILSIFLGPAGIATTHKTFNISPGEVILVFLGVAVVAGTVYLAILNPELAAVACTDACAQAAGEIIGSILAEACAQSFNNCDNTAKILKLVVI